MSWRPTRASLGPSAIGDHAQVGLRSDQDSARPAVDGQDIPNAVVLEFSENSGQILVQLPTPDDPNGRVRRLVRHERCASSGEASVAPAKTEPRVDRRTRWVTHRDRPGDDRTNDMRLMQRCIRPRSPTCFTPNGDRNQTPRFDPGSQKPSAPRVRLSLTCSPLLRPNHSTGCAFNCKGPAISARVRFFEPVISPRS